jgi:SpoVK/Ycf46/Vps4 family AAA+-type ATPase
MEKPLRSSSKFESSIDATRPTARTADAPSRPLRILVTATSREAAFAQARRIAAKLSRELQPIDLRQVESKYIREAEKKLLALVDTAEEAGAILFFDEADALFGKRSNVQTAHDRYVNLETSYILQQIENYPGTVIIATTQPAWLDSALLKQHAFSEERARVVD